MSSEKEFEGSSEQEALNEAALALGVHASELDYTLLDEGAAAVFGMGARPAKIRVSIPQASKADSSSHEPVEEVEAEPEGERPRWIGPAPEKAAKAEEIAKTLLKHMEVQGEVVVRDEEEVIIVELKDVEGSSSVEELFSSSRPPLGPSFQFLLNKMVNRFPADRKHILLKAPGRTSPRYSRAHGERGSEEFDPELVSVAKLLWERALKTKRVITVHPMHSGDRRAIHQTIMGLDDVKTVSAGEGIYRRMYVLASSLDSRRNPRKRRRPNDYRRASS